MSRANVVAALAAVLVMAVPVHARQTGPERDAEAFRQRLLDALARGDRGAVAGMIQYRLIVEAGFLIPVADRTELFRLWGIAFSPATRCLIEEADFRAPVRRRRSTRCESTPQGFLSGMEVAVEYGFGLLSRRGGPSGPPDFVD